MFVFPSVIQQPTLAQLNSAFNSWRLFLSLRAKNGSNFYSTGIE